MTVRLKEKYQKEIMDKLKGKFKYKNQFEIPKLEKVVINMGVGEAVKDNKKIDTATSELAAITGQKPIVTKAKKDISNFRLYFLYISWVQVNVLLVYDFYVYVKYYETYV